VNRDASDARLVDYVLREPSAAKVGQARVRDYNPGGFPRLAAVASGAVCPAGQTDNSSCRCLDTDGDGMPDLWELAHGLDPRNAADGPALNPDGFTNLERYLNGP
jgi:hypothetical protein